MKTPYTAPYTDPYTDPYLTSPSPFLREVSLDEDAVSKAIVGTIGELDSPMLPDAKGYTSLFRHLFDEDASGRQERRDQVLHTTEAHFREFADVLDAVKSQGNVVVVGSKDAISEANDHGAIHLETDPVM